MQGFTLRQSEEINMLIVARAYAVGRAKNWRAYLYLLELGLQ